MSKTRRTIPAKARRAAAPAAMPVSDPCRPTMLQGESLAPTPDRTSPEGSKRQGKKSAAAPESKETGWIQRVEPLLFFSGGGHELRRDRSYFYDCRHRLPPRHVCLQLTLSGTGFYENRQGRIDLPAGSAFLDLIPGDFSYGYATISHGPYELLYLSFMGPAAERWAVRLIERFGHVLHLGLESPVVTAMASLVRRQDQGLLPDRYQLSGELYQILMMIFSQMSRAKLADEPRIKQAMNIIQRRMADPSLNVLTLAQELDCSREYFCRQFHRVVGLSPLDYLTQQRLKRAAQQLRQSDDKLERVAHGCGFRTATYFCRVFRKQLGLTPAQFRQHPTAAIL